MEVLLRPMALFITGYFTHILIQLNVSFHLDTLVQTLRRMLPYFIPLKPKLQSYCKLVIFYHLYRDLEFSIRYTYRRCGMYFQSDDWIRLRRFLNETTTPISSFTLMQTYLTELQTTFSLTEMLLNQIRQWTNLPFVRHYDLRTRMGAAFLHVMWQYRLMLITIIQIFAWTESSI